MEQNGKPTNIKQVQRKIIHGRELQPKKREEGEKEGQLKVCA